LPIFVFGVLNMFSTRFKWSLETNQLARLIETKRRAGTPLLDLTEANPTRAGFTYPTAEILAALAQPAALHYEPVPRGLAQAREAVAAYYAERGLRVAADQLFLTASTSEAYAYLFKLLCDQDDEVLVPQPSYPLFDFLAALEGVSLRPYLLEYVHPGGWRLDFAALEQSVTPRTRALLLVNPNNPTGSFLKRAELAQLNAFCQTHELALIVDEVFSDYLWQPAETLATSLVENGAALTFVLSGFSKILGLPQMKLGWIVTSGPASLRAAADERLELIADTFLSVSAPVQHAAADWLRWRLPLQQQIQERTQANQRWLANLVEGSPCRLLHAEGGWYATLEVPRHVSEEELVLRLLAEDDVLVHPGYFFDFEREAFLVLSLLTPPAPFQTACQRLFQRVVQG
jgi:alanine-synthesizing transaminase